MFAPDSRTPRMDAHERWMISSATAFFAPRHETMEPMPRADDFHARTDAQRAEDWTGECLFDCYND